jgi:TolB protein
VKITSNAFLKRLKFVRATWVILGDCLMKILRFFLLCCLSVLLCSAIFAQAPTTAKIAFVSRGINPSGVYQSNIYMMNPDGSSLANLISRRWGINHIAWEPSGQRILFCSDHEGKHDIHVMNADGTDAKPVFTEPRYRVEPAWSPDGKRIAYVASAKPMGRSIYIASTNGESSKPIVQVGHGGGQPDWSPDGTEIAFVAASRGIREIYILNVEAHTQRQLLPDKNPWMQHPAWSPDGEKIAFAWSPEKSGTGIYLVNRDGTGLEQITEPDRLRILSITWAPSGDELVYGKITRDSTHLFKVSLRDRGTQPLTHEMVNTEAIWFDPVVVVSVEPSASALITTWGKIKNKD